MVACEAPLRCGAGREVLHQHVGRGEQLLERGEGGRLLQVQRQAFLGPVDPDEMGGQALGAAVVVAGEVAAAGTFDLDHARAQVGQLAGAERRGIRVFE